MIRISDLRQKHVISVLNGEHLGEIQDVDIDLETGKIQALLIYRSNKVMKILGKEKDFLIQWSQIVKIGKDVILVELSPSELAQLEINEEKEPAAWKMQVKK